VWLPIGEERQTLLVPKAATIRQDGRDLVYTVADKPPADAKAAPPKAPAEGNGGAGAKDPKPAAAVGPAMPPIQFAIAVPIRIIDGYGRYMLVESPPLAPGMMVVTRGTYLLTHGSPVQVFPKENPPAEAPAKGQPAAAGGQAGASE
jgi:hypothetical protein